MNQSGRSNHQWFSWRWIIWFSQPWFEVKRRVCSLDQLSALVCFVLTEVYISYRKLRWGTNSIYFFYFNIRSSFNWDIILDIWDISGPRYILKSRSISHVSLCLGLCLSCHPYVDYFVDLIYILTFNTDEERCIYEAAAMWSKRRGCIENNF